MSSGIVLSGPKLKLYKKRSKGSPGIRWREKCPLSSGRHGSFHSNLSLVTLSIELIDSVKSGFYGLGYFQKLEEIKCFSHWVVSGMCLVLFTSAFMVYIYGSIFSRIELRKPGRAIFSFLNYPVKNTVVLDQLPFVWDFVPWKPLWERDVGGGFNARSHFCSS